MAQQPPVGQGPLIIESSQSHPDTPQSDWLLWTSDRHDAETSTWKHTTNTRDKCPCRQVGFEPAIPTLDPSQIHALDRPATGTGSFRLVKLDRAEHSGCTAEQACFNVWNSRRSTSVPSGFKRQPVCGAVLLHCPLYRILFGHNAATPVGPSCAHCSTVHAWRWLCDVGQFNVLATLKGFSHVVHSMQIYFSSTVAT